MTIRSGHVVGGFLGLAVYLVLLSILVLTGCAGKKRPKLDQSYAISFQRQDKIEGEKKKLWAWQGREVDVVGDNYIKGEIKGVSSIEDLVKLKAMLEALKFIVLPPSDLKPAEPEVKKETPAQ